MNKLLSAISVAEIQTLQWAPIAENQIHTQTNVQVNEEYGISS